MDLSQLHLDEKSYEEMRAAMNIFDEDKFKKALIAISRISAEVVGSTVGPYARTVIIGDGYTHYPTKDGWSVLKKLSFHESIYQELFGIFKDVSYTLASKVGDGTSTAVLAANAFIDSMVTSEHATEVARFRQTELTKSLEKVVNSVTAILEREAAKHSIDKNGDFSDIRRIAMISSNGNEELSDIIQKIYQETKNPNIYVTLGNSDKLEYTIENGYRLTGSTIAHRAYVNSDEGVAKFTTPIAVAVFDHNINWNDHHEVFNVLAKLAAKRNQKLLIVAPSYDDITAQSIGATVDKHLARGVEPTLCVFTAPVGMDHMRKSLADFATLVGAHIIDYPRVAAYNRRVYEESGASMEDVKFKDTIYDQMEDYINLNSAQLIEQCLGTSINTVLGEKYLIIRDYDTERDMVKQIMREAKEEYETLKNKLDKAVAGNDTEYMRAAARYNRLSGAMGTINVGADSDLSQRCLKDAVDDAVLACKSAFDHGYVKGLNVDCLRAIREFANQELSPVDRVVSDILHHSIAEASFKVLENKYGDRTSIIPELHHPLYKDIDSTELLAICTDTNMVYNLVTDSFEKDDDATVIQSVRTDIEVLRALSSILTLILTSSHMISTNQHFDRDAIEELQNKRDLAKFEAKVGTVFDTFLRESHPMTLDEFDAYMDEDVADWEDTEESDEDALYNMSEEEEAAWDEYGEREAYPEVESEAGDSDAE